MDNKNQRRHIFLTGMKHTGKSLLAKLVAREMDRDVLDIDDEIERLYFAAAGRKAGVRTIYGLDDGATFRRLEAEACRLVRETPYPLIVATGGGLCDNADAVAELSSSLTIVLDAPADVLFARIIRKGIPAFLSADNNTKAWQEFERLYRRRSALYQAMADGVVEVNDRPPAEIVAELVIRIEEHLDGGQ